MRRHGKLTESASLKVQPVELFLRHCLSTPRRKQLPQNIGKDNFVIRSSPMEEFGPAQTFGSAQSCPGTTFQLAPSGGLYAGAGSNCKHRAVVIRRHGKLAESASLKVQPVELFLRHCLSTPRRKQLPQNIGKGQLWHPAKSSWEEFGPAQTCKGATQWWFSAV